jgi:hypothetical protein
LEGENGLSMFTAVLAAQTDASRFKASRPSLKVTPSGISSGRTQLQAEPEPAGDTTSVSNCRIAEFQNCRKDWDKD